MDTEVLSCSVAGIWDKLEMEGLDILLFHFIKEGLNLSTRRKIIISKNAMEQPYFFFFLRNGDNSLPFKLTYCIVKLFEILRNLFTLEAAL
jgi:hypothetical protein